MPKLQGSEKMSEEYDLKESATKIGKLVPVLRDVHGNMIDGYHRVATDPSWPSVTLPNVTDPVQLAIARLATNVCRRKVESEEKRKLLGEIAKLTGWTPKEIAEKIGMNYRWVLTYIPEEYKRDYQPSQDTIVQASDITQESVQKVHAVEQPRHFLDVPIICSECGVGTRLYPELFKQVGDKWYCDKCAVNAKPMPKVEPKIVEPAKPQDSWEYRKARMQVPVSGMEQAIQLLLTEKGVGFESQKEFCVQKTVADFYFPNKNLAVYLDGEVHRGKEDRDEVLRELLSKRCGVKVLSIPYEGDSEKMKQDVLTQILEQTKEVKK
jgi:very-short-patch-repair endonuclease